MTPTRTRSTVRAAQRGMTFIEIMIGLAIVGLVIGGIGLMTFNRYSEGQKETARDQTTTIEQAVMTYRSSKNGKCPRTLMELRASGYIKKAPKDPWGHDYKFTCDGVRAEVEVLSAGPDGEAETDDDITNYKRNS